MILLLLKLSQPVPADGTLAASGADVSRDWRQLINQVGVVNVLLVVVSTAVWDYARIYDVDLVHAPRIEANFREQILQDATAANLDVAGSQSQSLKIRTWNRSFVAMVQYPSDCSSTAVVSRDLNWLQLLKLVHATQDLERIAMWAEDRVTVSGDL
jgi:hypothetical protein